MPGITDLVRLELRAGRKVTVMCRSSAVRRAVLATLASTGELWLGVDVLAIETMLAELEVQGRVEGAARNLRSLPDGHPWLALLKDRPRMLAHAHRLADEVATCEAIGRDFGPLATDPVVMLAESARSDPAVQAWRELLDLIRRRSSGAHGPDEGHAVIACGFGPDVSGAPFTHCGRVDARRRSLVEAVPEARRCSLARDGGWRSLRLQDDDIGTAGKAIETVHVSDVAAESRVAAMHVLRCLAREATPEPPVLLLYALPHTAERVRATLERNGVSATSEAGTSLRSHGLAALCADLAPIFESAGRRPIARHQLSKLLSSPVLARTWKHWPVGADPDPGLLDAAAADAARMSLRHLHEMLAHARRSTGSLEQWKDDFEQWSIGARDRFVGAQERWESDQDNAELAAARVAAARRRLSGIVAVQRITGLIKHASTGTFGAMADLIGDHGVRDAGSPAVTTLLAELRSVADRSVSQSDFDSILSRGVRSGVLPGAVCILPYHEYDGRESSLVVLLDLHSKGIAASPAPDPLCGAELARMLGKPAPEHVVRERLALLRCAVAHSGLAVAVVTHRGADARAVVPPLQLGLQGTPSVFDHALRTAGIPENAAREGFAREQDGARTSWDAQIDAEQCRAGRIVRSVSADVQLPPDLAPEASSVADYLLHDVRPAGAVRYLGRVGPHEPPAASASGIPDRFSFSPSRIGSFTGCMYRGWASSILRLSAKEEKGEDLSADEVGDEVHGILHRAMFSAQWADRADRAMVQPEERLDHARGSLAGHLGAETERRAAEVGGAPDGLVARARAGHLRRWKSHWPRFAERAVIDIVAARELREKRLIAVLKRTHDKDLAALRAWLGEDVLPGAKVSPAKAAGALVLRALLAVGDLGPPGVKALCERFHELGEASEWKGIGKADAAAISAQGSARLSAAWNDPDSALSKCRDAVVANWEGLPAAGDRVPLDGERAFDACVDLGTGLRIPVRGRVDLVVQRRFEGAAVAAGQVPVGIVDFKTGASAKVTRAEVFDSLLQPQLGVYGCSIDGNAHGEQGRLKVVALSISAVRGTGDEGSISLVDGDLDRFRTRLGSVLAPGVTDGDYALRPHPHACPILVERGAYCDFADACRLRALPIASEAEPSADDSEP